MKPILTFLLVSAMALAQSDAPAPNHDLSAERRQALDFMKQAEPLSALPLVEDLAAATPDDATVQFWLAYCLYAKARLRNTSAAKPALLKRAREAALRARELGYTSPLLNELLAILDTPGAAQQPYSSNKDANAWMKEGEAAFAKGDNEGALAAYSAALKIDPKLYTAALFGGDVCFRKKDVACAADWFRRAVAINPERETAYRYWGDALLAAGKMMEAREKFIEAIIAEPTQKPWAALQNWANRNNCDLTAPKIDRPQINDSPPSASEPSVWVSYTLTRAAWRKSLFAKNYPMETQYRHSLAEEVAALSAVVDAIDHQKATQLDPQLANLLALKRDGLLESWVLLSGSGAGIAQDYAAYRSAHHDELRAYFDKYIIHPR